LIDPVVSSASVPEILCPNRREEHDVSCKLAENSADRPNRGLENTCTLLVRSMKSSEQAARNMGRVATPTMITGAI
jgi:hypothetical protein